MKTQICLEKQGYSYVNASLLFTKKYEVDKTILKRMPGPVCCIPIGNVRPNCAKPVMLVVCNYNVSALRSNINLSFIFQIRA